MAVDWSKRLRDCRGQLVRHMKMNVAFVSDMMKNDVISASDRGQLDKIADKETKADKLLELVDKRGADGIKQLMWALLRNEERDLAREIDADFVATCERELDPARPAGLGLRRPHELIALSDCRAGVVSQLLVSPILLSQLVESNVITLETKEIIDAEKTQTRKADKLVSHIERHISSQQFDSFLQALEETHQKHIAGLIKKSMTERCCQPPPLQGDDIPKKLSKRLKRLLDVKGDVCPILVISRPDPAFTRDFIRQNFQFLDVIQWKAVFDFGCGISENSLYKYVKEDLGKIGITTSFETFDVRKLHNCKEVENIKSDISASSQMTWFFPNDSCVVEDEVLTLSKWKKKYREGFSEAVRYTAFDIVKCNRSLVVFLNLTDDEIMLANMKKICKKFENSWLIVTKSEEVASKLETNLKDLHDKSRCVSGIRWDHVNDTIMSLFRDCASGSCQLPTSSGAQVLLPVNKINYYAGLSILGCEDYSEKQQIVDLRRAGNFDEFEHDMEYRFYKGDRVDWWNFHFSHVLIRDAFQKILERVKTVAGQRAEHDQPVVRINLIHQPSAGGSTLAKSVLWNLRKEYRCAVVENVNALTLSHVMELRRYRDEENPLPVILLLDGISDDDTNEFFASLVQNAKETDRRFRASCVPCFIVLVCKREVNLPEKKGNNPNQFVLRAHLSDGEVLWLRKVYVTMEEAYKQHDPAAKYKRHNPQNFISFNILKSNFDHEYMKFVVSQYAQGITEMKERQLLKYVSLLNTYDIQGQSVPVTCFDSLMGQKWETQISEPLKVLLNQTARRGLGGERLVKIVNVDLSAYIYEEMTRDVEKNKLGQVMLEFLNSEIFMIKPDITDKLMAVIKNLMKKRLREVNEDGSLTEGKFSPFIQTIVDDCQQAVPVAADVLIRVFDLTKQSVPDLFVGQQIARLYIHARNWPKATEYGLLITESKDNSYLLDTLAQVYKCQVEEKCENSKGLLKGKPKTMSVPAKLAVEVLNLAFQAIDTFRQGQEASLHEGLTGLTKNMAGYFGELRTAVLLLNYMSLVDGLRRLADLRKFLIDDVFVPNQLQCWQEDKIKRVKSLHKSLMNTINYMEEEFCHLQPRTECFDPVSLLKYNYNQCDLHQNREKILHYFCEQTRLDFSVSTSKSEAVQCRLQIRLQGGDTMYGLLDKNISDVLYILSIVMKNKGTRFENMFDLKVYVAASLVLCMFGSSGKKYVTHEDVAECSFKLYRERESSGADLEPYLFAVMCNWPRKHLSFSPPLCAFELPKVFTEWKHAFRRKYPKKDEERKKETTLFFLGQGDGMDAFVSHRELEKVGSTIQSSYEFWSLEHVKNRLERFSGVLRRGDEISYVLMKLHQDGNECPVEIPTALPQKDSRMYNSAVSFYIGFTWSGPKAFGLGDPGNTEVLSEGDEKTRQERQEPNYENDFPVLNAGRHEMEQSFASVVNSKNSPDAHVAVSSSNKGNHKRNVVDAGCGGRFGVHSKSVSLQRDGMQKSAIACRSSVDCNIDGAALERLAASSVEERVFTSSNAAGSSSEVNYRQTSDEFHSVQNPCHMDTVADKTKKKQKKREKNDNGWTRVGRSTKKL